MATQAFYRKWRSQTFGELVGQEHVTRTLLNAVRTGRVAHAYVFSGPRGVGKTSAARLLAKAVNCEANVDGEPCNECSSCRAIAEGRAIDVIEIDAASNRKIDDIRDLREKVNFAPSQLRTKFYILDEAHQLTGDAADAFLKTLEEPPANTVFVLATTEAHSIQATILSRCQHLEFRRISLPAIVGRLRQICEAEAIEAEPAVLELVARAANGGLRDAEGLLDQLVAYSGKRIDVDGVRSVVGVAGDEAAHQLLECMVEHDLASGMRLINRLVEEGTDPRHFRQEVVEYLRGLMVLKSGADLSELLDVTGETLSRMSGLGARLSAAQVLQSLRVFAQAEPPTKGVTLGQLPLEMAFFEAALVLKGELPSAEVRQPADGASRSASQPPSRVASGQVATRAETPVRKPEAPKREPYSRPVPPEPEGVPAPPTQPSPATERPPAVPTAPRRDRADEDRATVGEVSFNELLVKWPGIIERMGNVNKQTQAFLRDVRPLSLDGGTARFGCRFQFHCDKLNDERSRVAVEGLMEQIIGRRCRATFVVDSGEGPREVSAADPFQVIMDDPLVKGAIGMGWRVKRVAKNGEVFYDAESQDDPAAAGATGEDSRGAR